MKHQSSNKSKSNNGSKFEHTFTELTGIVKEPKKNKPKFTNVHGLKQVIDYDFKTTINGVDIFVDVTTTFRSDRLKQKSYNALLMKLKVNPNCKYYLVVKSFTEKGKTKVPVLIEGIDDVMDIEHFMKNIFNNSK